MNSLVREVMLETMRQAEELSRIAKGVLHSPLRGQLRESFLKRALMSWLPNGLELGTGVIIDEHGSRREVNEDDIVIYAPNLIPAVLPLIDRNIFVLDSVVAHIEVKSKLTSTELKSSLINAIGISNLTTSYEGRREIKAIFAYSSDLVDKSELDRLNENIISLGWTGANPPISILCIANKVCYLHGHVHFGGIPDSVGSWYELSPGSPADSTLAFCSSIVSSLNDIRNERKFVQLSRFVLNTNELKIVH